MKHVSEAQAPLDVRGLAEKREQRHGVYRGAGFRRLSEGTAGTPADVSWAVRGEQRGLLHDEVWLRLECHGDVQFVCQRCLQRMTQTLTVDRWFRFVADESQAEQLDELCEEDVMVLPAAGLDLRALVEDELILALPIVPRHDVCPQPLLVPADEVEQRPPNPFSVLAGLKVGEPRDDQ